MKKGVVGLALFALVLSVFLLSNVVAVTEGSCAIVTRANCDNSKGEYILMGLSDVNNAHAQTNAPTYNNYPYVLCCALGDGNVSCSKTPSIPYGSNVPSNKVVGLSYFTNAHVQAVSESTYPSTYNICYEDLACLTSTTGCDFSKNEIGVVNLSASTNAHVGTGVGFQIAICCKSSKFLSTCQLSSAKWDVESAVITKDGKFRQLVRLIVTGSGSECDNQAVNFTVYEKDSPTDLKPVKTFPKSVGFDGKIATAVWEVEWMDDGTLQGNPEYVFKTTIERSIPLKSIMSSNELTVKQVDIDDICDTVSNCGDYKEPGICGSDLCGRAKDSNLPGFTCGDAGISCTCVWNPSKGICNSSYSEVKPGLCKSGFTLCRSPLKINYCYPGASCPSGSTNISDGDGKCEVDDSCASSDCKNGEQGSCVLGATCSGGKCSGTPTEAPRCGYGLTLCQEPTAKVNYCYPGATCLSTHKPVQDGDGKCEIGEGCSFPNGDCKNGDQDSCTSETFCSSGVCSSTLPPVEIPVLGGCKITQSVTKECNVDPIGYKTLTWSGVWTGDAASKTGSAYTRCIAGGSGSVPCPAQVQLPFFDYYEIAITVAVIALIYFSLVFRRKFKRKKK